MSYLMGIDGGGSNLRVAIVTPDLSMVGQAHGETANPAVVGHEAAAHVIQTAMRQALAEADLSPEHIAAVGIGIAGASAAHVEPWLREVVSAVTPQAVIVPSSDYEIALVGAHGVREGVLVLAGTGSVAYGVNAQGESLQIGGRGYLIGDEGSGFWLGKEALRAALRAHDGLGQPTRLSYALLDHLNLQNPPDLLRWLYRSPTPLVREIAALAPLVIAQAESGDEVATQLIRLAAEELALLVHTISNCLRMDSPHIALAGGLLQSPNLLTHTLCTLLGLPSIPPHRYPPVIGAAILARDLSHRP